MKRALLIPVLAVALASCGGGVDFESAVESSWTTEERATIDAYDRNTIDLRGDALTIDVAATNWKEQTDFDLMVEMGEYSEAVLGGLEDLLDELGFSSATWDRMQTTRAVDGAQDAETDELTAYWTYHPDNGLTLIFEPK